jgi:RNA polymerase sigma-70 factor (ECF subfamily)
VDQHSLNQHLSHISTLWSLVYQAHHGSAQAVSTAQRLLMERYSGAIHRYLVATLGDRDSADELFQEFSLRFLRGDFRNATPERGRFRSFVKTAVFHLIVDHHRQQQKRPQTLDQDLEAPADTEAELQARENDFRSSWREELLTRAWQALAEVENQTGQPCHTILHFRTEQPLLTSAELAEQLGRRLGKSYTVHAIRQALHRARDIFADLLLQEVAQSLANPTQEGLTDELIDLGLLTYCRSALDRRFAPE